MNSELKQPCASILLLGEDLRLVETRRWVLEKAGYRLRTALNLADAEQMASAEPIQLFVLCDSLRATARDEALALLHTKWPGTRRLVLTCANEPVKLGTTEVLFTAIEGPRKLIAVIKDLIAGSEPSLRSPSTRLQA